MNHEKKPSFTLAALDLRQLLLSLAVVAGMALLLVIGLRPRPAEAPSAQAGADSTLRLHEECQLIQHLTYVPCGHELTRRMQLPAELAGQDRSALAAAYDLWQITDFSPDEVTMTQQADLFCPDHIVLMADEAGMLCVWQNRYGDAYALMRELNLPLTDLPENIQDQLREGVAFETEEALGAYLESIES